MVYPPLHHWTECVWGLDTALNLCAQSARPAGVRPVHEAPCCVDGRLFLSSAPSHQELHQVVASWGCPLLSLRGWTATTACSPARLRASWTDSSRSSMPQRGSSATGGSMTTSRRSSAMFSTGCQSHSASSTSSVYSSSYHFTELLQSTCAIAASGLIPPRLGYVYDHLRRPIFGCGG